jgi:Flp pilus assembly protein TadD
MALETIDRAAALREVQAAIKANDLKLATAKALAALEAGVEHPMLLNLRALRSEEEGRPADALEDLKRARQLAPNDFTVVNALGLCFARLERYAEAAEAFAAAVALEPRFAPAHHNIGWLKDIAGDLEGARAAHEAALQMNPAFAEASASLAMLAVRQQDWTGARIHADKALKNNPRLPTAQTALAAIDLAQGQYASAEARLRLLLSGDTRMFLPQVLVFARGLWADALDGMDRVPEAFAAYQAEKRELAGLHAARYQGKPGLSDFAVWAGAYFAASQPWVRTEAAAPAVQHVFIAGFPGSGVERLGRTFEDQDGAVVMSGRDAFADAVRAWMADAAALDRLRDASPEELAKYRDLYWSRAREQGFEPKGGVFVDAAPMNLLKLPLVARLFPHARVLIARRDPRDVALAALRRHERSLNAAGYELLTVEGAARFQAGALALAELYLEKLPIQAEVMRYEDQEGDEPAEGWRRYAAQLAPVAPLLDPWVERFGYPAD